MLASIMMPLLQLRCQPPCGAPSGFLSVACFSAAAGGFLAAAAFCTPPCTLGCSDARRSLEAEARLPSAVALWAGDGFALAIFSLMLATWLLSGCCLSGRLGRAGEVAAAAAGSLLPLLA